MKRLNKSSIWFSLLSVGLALSLSGCTGCSSQPTRRSSRNVEKGYPQAVPASPTARRESGPSASRESFKDVTSVRMKSENGVYKIPVLINGSEMDFIFDTGAGLISISAVEASFLYKQGKISEEDLLGKANFIDANGDISEGTIINLREVTIGNRTIHNIEASVVNNLVAPLLLGQSALQKFGKVSIDYTNNQIVFE